MNEPPTSEWPESAAPRIGRSQAALLLCAGAITLGLVASQSTLALVILALDGPIALAIILAATLGGLWLADALLGKTAPWRWRVLLSAALGLGGVGLLVLACGVLGWLDRTCWLALLAIMSIAGVLRLWRCGAGERGCSPERLSMTPAAEAAATTEEEAEAEDRCQPDREAGERSAGRFLWLWLAVCPFAALAILAAVTPPGVLWAEEGNGYDVLEYHLQLPKEYLEAGRIDYVPHNVYANFPANVEMLYLLSLLVRGDVVEGALLAKLLNLGLAVLFVAAAWLAGRETSRVAGVFSGVAAGGAGYVAYLCGVAFVELGMLFFGMLALAAFIRAIDPARPEGETGRYVMAAGLLAGLAVGCKYTALVLIALPLGLALVIRYLPNRRRRYRTPLLFTAGVLAAFSPWLVKNAVMTGNPVFPLANAVFRATPPGWGMEQSDHFAECHSLAPEDRSASNRLALLWEHVFGDEWQRFGPPVFVLALIALVVGGRGHGRIEWYCLVILAVQVAVWLSATHLYARFAVPFLLPLVVLAGRSIEAAWAWRGRGLLAVVLLVGLGFNLDHLAKLYRQHLYVDGRKIPLEGATGFFTNGMGLGHEHLAVVNHELPESARILMLGDAKAFYFRRAVDYHVVFNRHPFAEMLRAGASPAEALQWLRDRAYSHVLVNWPEIKRLRQSRYGFPEEINPELFRRLAPAGLVHQRTILTASSGVPYADLFTVPSPH